MRNLMGRVDSALTGRNPRVLVEQAALALLTYIEEETDGFRILVRDSPVASSSGTFSSLLSDVASQVEHILVREFQARDLDTELAGMYAQMLVGMVALTGQWWLEVRSPSREVVAAHLVNLGWNGLRGLEPNPRLSSQSS
jgi:AcrR family transcriptional regulator